MKPVLNISETCRIIVSLKSVYDVELPVTAATTLAAAINAEVIGLFVREDAMIDLAGLPFVRAINVGSKQPVQITQKAMEQAFQHGAMLCRRTLSAMAEKAQVKWSFNTEQGELSAKTRDILMAGDFLVLEGSNYGSGLRLLIDELHAMSHYSRGVVVAARRRELRNNGPVIAIDDGDAAGEKTVALAARIARVIGTHLDLFAVAASDAEAEHIAQRARKLAGAEVGLQIHRFAPGAPGSIVAATANFSPVFIVVDLEGEPFKDDQTTRALLRAANAPVVLLRSNTKDNAD